MSTNLWGYPVTVTKASDWLRISPSCPTTVRIYLPACSGAFMEEQLPAAFDMVASFSSKADNPDGASQIVFSASDSVLAKVISPPLPVVTFSANNWLANVT